MKSAAEILRMGAEIRGNPRVSTKSKRSAKNVRMLRVAARIKSKKRAQKPRGNPGYPLLPHQVDRAVLSLGLGEMTNLPGDVAVNKNRDGRYTVSHPALGKGKYERTYFYDLSRTKAVDSIVKYGSRAKVRGNPTRTKASKARIREILGIHRPSLPPLPGLRNNPVEQRGDGWGVVGQPQPTFKTREGAKAYEFITTATAKRPRKNPAREEWLRRNDEIVEQYHGGLLIWVDRDSVKKWNSGKETGLAWALATSEDGDDIFFAGMAAKGRDARWWTMDRDARHSGESPRGAAMLGKMRKRLEHLGV